jgi:hypothetical protein
MTKKRIKCGNCPKRFTPKRSNQRHCSPACRNASYEKSAKGVARQKRYNATAKRQTVQAAYARSEKGAVRRDRWQYSKAGRAWRKAWYAPERVAEREEIDVARRKAAQEARENELREQMQLLAEESGVSLSEAVNNYLYTGWRSADTEKYLRHWLSERRKAA